MDDATQKLVDEAREFANHPEEHAEHDLIRRLAAALEAAQRPPVSPEVLSEYRKVAAWLDGKAAVLSPVGDTMHALAAEALHMLIEREEDRSRVSKDDPIPRYAQLDVWMALFGAERSEEYEPFREEHGFAETWSWLLAQVRRPPVSLEVLAQAFHEGYERLAPEFGYRTREASAVPWEEVPAENKALMVATSAEVLARFSFPTLDPEKVARFLVRRKLGFLASQANDVVRAEAAHDAAALVAALQSGELTREGTNE